jgi:hypothetical protein
MVSDYMLPPEADWTVDDLAILPAGCRRELIDGRLDLWDRDTLARLVGLALMAELKAACPPGFRVQSCVPTGGAGCAAPDITVFAPEGNAVLVVDVLHPGRHLAEMLGRLGQFWAAGVTRYWLLETADGVGAALTAFRAAKGGGFEVESGSRGVFAAEKPFPMSVDLPLISERWPQTFEYVGDTAVEIDRQ